LDILQDACDFFGSGLDLDIFLNKNWIRTGSGYLFDFYNEIFLRVIQDVTNDCAVVFFAMIFTFTQKIKMILSVCAALITIDDNSCYFIVNIFRRGESSKLLLYYCSDGVSRLGIGLDFFFKSLFFKVTRFLKSRSRRSQVSSRSGRISVSVSSSSSRDFA